jgi:hypothetical protein
MNSKTRMTTFRKLADAGELAPLLVQLMMAVNDLSIADHGLRYWHSEIPVPHENRVQGSKSYFVRLQIAHTFEALKVIYRLKNKPAFMAKVEQCDRATNAAFNRLVAVIGTEEYQKMKRLRNAITFHYETQAIQDAINRQSAKFPDYAMPLSTGSTTLDWYFEPGDRIVDSVIIRDALAMTSDPAVSAAVDKIVGACKRLRKIWRISPAISSPGIAWVYSHVKERRVLA